MKRTLTIHFYLLIVSIIGLTQSLNAANFSSAASGAWNLFATWNKTAPSSNTSDNITINHNVSNTSSTIIKNGGSLTVKAGKTLTINNNLEFSNGSTINIEAGGNLVVTGNLTNKNNSDQVTINGSIAVSGNFTNGSGGVVTGTGAIQVTGSFLGSGTTFSYTNSEIKAGTTIEPGSLPVELLYFNHEINNEKVVLNWATASEINNNFFTIERSTDGMNFEVIETIAGTGNSNEIQTYQYIDNKPINGISYYRLKQTDYDGKAEYISTIICKTKLKEELIFEINGFTSNSIDITVNGEAGQYQISIYNTSGQQISTSSLNIDNTTNRISIPSQELSNGCYILSLTTPRGEMKSVKVVR